MPHKQENLYRQQKKLAANGYIDIKPDTKPNGTYLIDFTSNQKSNI